jgi:hypothetical protein
MPPSEFDLKSDLEKEVKSKTCDVASLDTPTQAFQLHVSYRQLMQKWQWQWPLRIF